MPEHFCSALRSLYTRAADCSAPYSGLAFAAHTQITVAHPWRRSCHSSAAPSPGKAPLPLGSPSLLRSYGSLHTYSAVGSSILTAVAAHSTPLRLDVYYISLQLQQASAQYIPTLTLGTFRHRTAGTFPAPAFGHHSIGPQRGTGRGVFIGVDLGPAIRLRTVGPEAPGHKVPRRFAGLGSLPRFPGVLLPFLCQANKRL